MGWCPWTESQFDERTQRLCVCTECTQCCGSIPVVALVDTMGPYACGSATGKQVKTFLGHDNAITCLCAGNFKTLQENDHRLHSRALIVSGSKDRTVRIWDLEQGWCLLVLLEHARFVKAVAVSSPNRESSRIHAHHPVVLSTCDSGQVIFWDGHSGRQLGVSDWHTASGKGIATISLPGNATTTSRILVASCSWV